MKKQCLIAVLTLICLVVLGVAVQAQTNDEVVANVPFEFVAGGTTFSAGTYSVSRVSSAWDSHLIIHNGEHSAFLLPVAFDGRTLEGGQLSFEHVGNHYFLNKVKTPEGVYTITHPEAEKKIYEAMSSSGTN